MTIHVNLQINKILIQNMIFEIVKKIFFFIANVYGSRDLSAPNVARQPCTLHPPWSHTTVAWFGKPKEKYIQIKYSLKKNERKILMKLTFPLTPPLPMRTPEFLMSSKIGKTWSTGRASRVSGSDTSSTPIIKPLPRTSPTRCGNSFWTSARSRRMLFPTTFAFSWRFSSSIIWKNFYWLFKKTWKLE